MEDEQQKIGSDKYGFVKSTREGEDFMGNTEGRDKEWFTFLSKLGVYDLPAKLIELSAYESQKGDRREFERLVQTGIPVAFRQQIWMALAGRGRGGVGEYGDFEYLVAGAGNLPDDVLKGIRKDLDRTFPGHAMFDSEGGELSLEKVLVAFACRYPDVGYCQGLNMYAGQFLQFMSEEDSYIMLCHFVKGGLLPEAYYDFTMQGRMVDGLVLEHLIRKEMPKVHEHLSTLDFEVSVATGMWFSQCFTGCFSEMELVFRVFDLLLSFGNIILFKLTLHIIAKSESRIIAADSAHKLHHLFARLAKEVTAQDLRDAASYRLRTTALETLRHQFFGKKKSKLDQEVERLRRRYKVKTSEALTAGEH